MLAHLLLPLAALDLAGAALLITAISGFVLGLLTFFMRRAPPTPPAGDPVLDAIVVKQLARENVQLQQRVQVLEHQLMRANIVPEGLT